MRAGENRGRREQFAEHHLPAAQRIHFQHIRVDQVLAQVLAQYRGAEQQRVSGENGGDDSDGGRQPSGGVPARAHGAADAENEERQEKPGPQRKRLTGADEVLPQKRQGGWAGRPQPKRRTFLFPLSRGRMPMGAGADGSDSFRRFTR